MAYDRDEVLGRIQLDELCDELLGPRKGRDRSASWSCPSPNHGPQTGRTPPLSVFRSRAGEQRWRCHGCGAGGTALDLVMVLQEVDFKRAIELLAGRTGVRPTARVSATLRPSPPRPIHPLPAAPPNAAVESYVADCERLLASPTGAQVRNWLVGRGFSPAILAANRVGADPGPKRLPRAKGLPRGGLGAVFPVLEDGRAVYAQLRYLHPRKCRWVNPSARLAPSPHLALTCLAGAARRSDVLIITEGLTDALTAGDAGYPAVALLGVGLVDKTIATTLLKRWPTQHLVVAFDAGSPGRRGSTRLISLISEVDVAHPTSTLDLPAGFDDLNDWRQAAGHSFRTQLDHAIGKIGPVRSPLDRGQVQPQDNSRASLDSRIERWPLARPPSKLGGDGIGLSG